VEPGWLPDLKLSGLILKLMTNRSLFSQLGSEISQKFLRKRTNENQRIIQQLAAVRLCIFNAIKANSSVEVEFSDRFDSFYL
jgi:hypothetical protein